MKKVILTVLISCLFFTNHVFAQSQVSTEGLSFMEAFMEALIDEVLIYDPEIRLAGDDDEDGDPTYTVKIRKNPFTEKYEEWWYTPEGKLFRIKPRDK